METTFQVSAIGKVKLLSGKKVILLESKYLAGLTQIEGFSHLQILWWAHLTDNPQNREKLIAEKLFKNAPDITGIFCTRSPVRPNPIMISTIKVERVDTDKGIIHTPFIDAETDSPVLDIKPYFPMERVKNCKVPKWFDHWPKWAEDSVDFDWSNEINFG
ncbi:TrmO family methyltransferase domain-containing protein [Marinilabilia rubra]|uniref:tRNA (N6-threonylcarbamoyladenosine(37)-N6)-methyltransferase TrmO n=1 Tax=Marinilabilia rubra TaxID=2162893 RepID=A0A2U2B5C3_9BACT|nr:TrmO family methyltransferase [Marinilabilia rubra]PWD98267.1 tRNA (N6-threonylcarbamoyladenosine(37)-N6)-methyltransferase TrmO [Marinilabilia rubra]